LFDEIGRIFSSPVLDDLAAFDRALDAAFKAFADLAVRLAVAPRTIGPPGLSESCSTSLVPIAGLRLDASAPRSVPNSMLFGYQRRA